MKQKKKRKLFNAIMAVAAVIIVAAGVWYAGNLRGWFDKDTGVEVSKEDGTAEKVLVKVDGISGSVGLQRGGLSFNPEVGSALKAGDVIETGSGGSADLIFGDSVISLEEKTRLEVDDSGDGRILFSVKEGAVFADVADQCDFEIFEKKFTAVSCVFAASAPAGSANIYLLSGELSVGDVSAEAGYAFTILSDEVTTREFSAETLNDFELEKVNSASKLKKLCFSGEEAAKVIADRKAASQKTISESLNFGSGAPSGGTDASSGSQGSPSSGSSSSGGSASGGTSTGSSGSGGSTSGNTSGGGSSGTATEPSAPKTLTCTIEIRCNTILNNMSDLAAGKEGYVPSDGTILPATTVTFEEGESVLEILRRSCDAAGIQLEATWNASYGSSYVEGINNLYQFDCGSTSGWMYKVNGYFPNYGCSAYIVKEGDVIVWCYTCKGLGADVGGGM